uniref:Glucuronosyltransferase n=1 Tax=Meloidogyne hapla TaxID=6305 RepID=A0A1I8BNR7_MELHA
MARMFMNNSLLYGSDKSNNEHKYINSVCKLTEFYYGKRNHPFKKYLELVNKYNLEKKEMPKIQDLLRKSKYYLINVHQFGKYFVEENSENQETFSKRIVYIGGIGVEIEGKIKQKNINEKIKRKRAHYKNKMKNLFNGKNKQTISLNVQNNIGGNLNFISGDEKELNWIKTEKCLVIFSFGESVDFESFSREHIKVLVETFENHKECKFIVRNGTFAINNYNSVNINFQRINKFSNVYMNKKGKNILLFDGMIDQQKILGN